MKSERTHEENQERYDFTPVSFFHCTVNLLTPYKVHILPLPEEVIEVLKPVSNLPVAHPRFTRNGLVVPCA